jgi:hypothetical protein
MTVGLTTSGIIVHHMPSGLGVSCDSERSQHQNKEKALQLLEALIFTTESEKSYKAAILSPVLSTPDRVRMIKEVRIQAGCGLKEAKEAVDHILDLYPNMDIEVVVEFAIPYACRKPSKGCTMPQGHPTHCGCEW